jgi:hypothetical protein
VRSTLNDSVFSTTGWKNERLNLRVDSKQCVVVYDPDPSGKFGLVPAIEPVRDAANTQTQVDQYTSALLRNGGRPGFVVTTEGAINDNDRQRFLSEWQSLYGGAYNAGKTAILEGAKWDLKEISPLKPQDVSNENFFRDSVRKVGMAFGVPEFELGLTESVNKASSAEIRVKFLTGTIVPMYRTHERAWTRQFFQRFGIKHRLQFNEFSLPEFADVIATRVENVAKLIAAGTPRNEAYRINGIPVNDVDWGDTGFLPTTLGRAEDMAKEPSEPVAVPAIEPSKTPIEDPTKLVIEGSATRSEVKRIRLSQRLKAIGSKADTAIAVECWSKCVTPFEEPIAAGTTKWVKRYKGHFLKRLNHFLKTGQHLDETSPLAKDVSRIIEWKSSEDPNIPSDQDVQAMLPDQGMSVAGLQGQWRGVFGSVEDATALQMGKELDSLSAWPTVAPEARRGISLARLGDAIGVDDTIRKQLTAVLHGELSRTPMPHPVQIASALRAEAAHVFDKAFVRAATIARTEVGSVMGDYRRKIMETEGVQKKRWSAVHDGHTRQSHLDASGDGSIPMSSKFSNGLDRPHDPNGTAADVCNCRCVLIAGEK